MVGIAESDAIRLRYLLRSTYSCYPFLFLGVPIPLSVDPYQNNNLIYDLSSWISILKTKAKNKWYCVLYTSSAETWREKIFSRFNLVVPYILIYVHVSPPFISANSVSVWLRCNFNSFADQFVLWILFFFLL